MLQTFLTKLRTCSLQIILATMAIAAILAALIGVKKNYFSTAAENWRYQISDNTFDSGYMDGKNGDCVTWDVKNKEDRVITKCNKAHRFEIAGKSDLADSYNKEASYPNISEWVSLQKQLCTPLVKDTFKGDLDPDGKFVIGALLPTEKEWNNGSRHVTCGVELRNYANNDYPPLLYTSLKDTDQSIVFPPGTCLFKNPDGALSAVDCRKKHQFEVTKIFSLDNPRTLKTLHLASGKQPTEKEQNDALENYCDYYARTYFGEKTFKKSGLLAGWNTISDASWKAGSRKSFCYVTAFSENKVHEITGSLKSKDGILVDGKKPNYVEEAPPGRSLPKPVTLPQDTGL